MRVLSGRQVVSLFCALLGVAWLSDGSATAQTVVTNSDPVVLRAAIAQGGSIRLAFDGDVLLTEPFTISTNTSIDASGHAVSLNGGDAVRHFVVTAGATLRLVNLTLNNGRFTGAVGATNQAGEPGWGGSVYNSAGILELIDCRFHSNQVNGGKGGPLQSIFGGTIPTAGGPAYGGAVYAMNGQLLATNCVFSSNISVGGKGNPGTDIYTGGGGNSFGGAIYLTNSQSVLVGVGCTNNTAQAGEPEGGRAAYGGGQAYGGAFADASATTTILQSSFVSNKSLGSDRFAGLRETPNEDSNANGGAIYHESGAILIRNSTMNSNLAKGGIGIGRRGLNIYYGNAYGGAIYNLGKMDLDCSTLTSNQALGASADGRGDDMSYFFGGNGSGGAICHVAGSLRAVNCTVFENSATGGSATNSARRRAGSAYGGAIVVSGGDVSLLNVTVAGNSVQAGDTGQPTEIEQPKVALGASIFATNGVVTLTNTILSSLPGQTNLSGTIIDGGHNLASDSSAGFTAPSNLVAADLFLGPLGDNSGPTPTMALLPASPAIDGGDNSVCPSTDQRGVSRPMGGACDIGAFELAPQLNLTIGSNGITRIDYTFRAGRTNEVIASTNLVEWLPLGTRVSDRNGFFRFEDADSLSFPNRFYRVQQ